MHQTMKDDIRSNHAMRLGFREIKGISQDDAKVIMAGRLLSSPPPLRGRSAREARREGGMQQPREQAFTPLPTPPPHAKSDVSDFAQFENGRTREHPRSAWGREPSEQAAEIVPYTSIRDVWLRTGLKQSVLERLADADAFGSLGLTRRQALWAVKVLGRAGDQDDLPLLTSPSSLWGGSAREARRGGGHCESHRTTPTPDPSPQGGGEPASASGNSSSHREPPVTLPPMPLGEEVVNDYRFLKLSLRAHPASFLRADLAARGIIPNEELRTRRNGEYVRVSGLVTIRQRPGSANGVIFMTIEDETSIANLIVWPKTFERFRPIVLGARYICATGKMQQQSGVIHVVADKLEDLTSLLGQLMEDEPPIESYARADEVKGQQSDPRDRASRTERYAAFADTIDVAADLGITAPGSAHAPTRKAAPKAR
jgi:error-prone DNA polymerase